MRSISLIKAMCISACYALSAHSAFAETSFSGKAACVTSAQGYPQLCVEEAGGVESGQPKAIPVAVNPPGPPAPQPPQPQPQPFDLSQGNYDPNADPNADTDNDGIINQYDPDDDNDGVGDWRELILGGDPQDPNNYMLDSDGDGYNDAAELAAGSDPFDSNDMVQSIDTDQDGNIDNDGDTLSDLVELVHGTDLNDPDTDNDGISDYVEIYTTYTNPLDVDTDDDGVNDGDEIANGTDPNNPNSQKIVPPPGNASSPAIMLLPAHFENSGRDDKSGRVEGNEFGSQSGSADAPVGNNPSGGSLGGLPSHGGR